MEKSFPIDLQVQKSSSNVWIFRRIELWNGWLSCQFNSFVHLVKLYIWLNFIVLSCQLLERYDGVLMMMSYSRTHFKTKMSLFRNMIRTNQCDPGPHLLPEWSNFQCWEPYQSSLKAINCSGTLNSTSLESLAYELPYKIYFRYSKYKIKPQYWGLSIFKFTRAGALLYLTV